MPRRRPFLALLLFLIASLLAPDLASAARVFGPALASARAVPGSESRVAASPRLHGLASALTDPEPASAEEFVLRLRCERDGFVRHRFVRNNPLKWVDPTGLIGESPWDLGWTAFDVAMAKVHEYYGDEAGAASWRAAATLDLMASAIPGAPATGGPVLAVAGVGRVGAQAARGAMAVPRFAGAAIAGAWNAARGLGGSDKGSCDFYKGNTQTDRLKEHLTPRDLDAARREAAGEVVARKKSGVPWDHLKEVREAQQGLLNRLEAINRRLGWPGLGQVEREALMRELSEASRLLDHSEGFVPR